MMVPTRNPQKEQQRRDIERMTRDYIKRGGRVMNTPPPPPPRPVGRARAYSDVRRDHG